MSRRRHEDEEEPSILETAVRWWDSQTPETRGMLKMLGFVVGGAVINNARTNMAQQPPQPPPPAAAPPPVDEAQRIADAALLGCSPYPSTAKEVKQAYHRRSLELHPDKGGHVESFKLLGAAYERHRRRVPNGQSR